MPAMPWTSNRWIVAAFVSLGLSVESGGCARTPTVTEVPADPAEQEIVGTVQQLFDALRVRDVNTLERVMVPDVLLVVADASGRRTVTRDQFIAGLLGSDLDIEERIWRPEVAIDGPLATLRAPYDVQVDGERSHCGTDVVQLVRDGDAWRVVSVVSSKRVTGCTSPDAPVVPSRLTSLERHPVPADAAVTGRERQWSVHGPRNIVLVIADGFGFAALRALRAVRDDPTTPRLEMTRLDRHLVGTVATDPAGPAGTITDSAAAATAMATGVSTLNGRVGVDPTGRPLVTVFDRAVDRGKRVGLVVTSAITHATPAAFVAHHIDRAQGDALADQYVMPAQGDQPLLTLALGGGRQYFQRDDRDLTALLAKLGYDVVTTAEELDASRSDRVFGLFAPDGLAAAKHRPDGQPTLPHMTATALERLVAAPQGFVLLVEASQIDWAAHANDVVTLMAELEEFAATADLLFDFADRRNDTLIVITADHETGGLAVGAGGAKRVYVSRALAARETPAQLRDRIMAGENPRTTLRTGASVVTSAQVAGNLRRVAGSASPDASETVLALVKDAIDRFVGVGWTTRSHTAVDVPLIAFGPGADRFHGFHRNTDLAAVLFELVESAAPDHRTE
ncbi:MAG: DUF4440 domain-containing protein [Myxococcales bacterium FL481]|nr:MAG: DUF4440 domain-containing protein [Myxococcales bacterium FL481]